NRRLGVDLHLVADDRLYLSITIRHREGANKHPRTGKRACHGWQRRPTDPRCRGGPSVTVIVVSYLSSLLREFERRFSMRGIARQRLGFYPLPQKEAKRIRRFLSFFEDCDATSVLDPCAGGGAAMATITSGAKTLTYGIELDAF